MLINELRVAFDELNAAQTPRARQQASRVTSRSLFANVGAEHSELDEMFSEQTQLKADEVGDQDDGSSDTEQVLVDHDV